MPTLSCPDCLASFPASGPAGTCPTCGAHVRLAAAAPVRARPVDDSPRPSRRRAPRDEDDDDDDDDRPARPRRRRAASGGGTLLPMLMIGGAVAVLLVVGVMGFVVYRALAGGDQAKAPTPPAPAFNPPAFAPAPQPPVMAPAPNPFPPAGPGAAGGAAVTLSNFRRERGGIGSELTVDYSYTAGGPALGRDVLIVKTLSRTYQVDLVGGLRQSGSVSFRLIGGAAAPGMTEAWMERRDGFGMFANPGQRISNTVNLN